MPGAEFETGNLTLQVMDSAAIGREFEPVFAPQDLVNLPNYSVYLKLMIDGAPSKPFSATTLHPQSPESYKR